MLDTFPPSMFEALRAAAAALKLPFDGVLITSRGNKLRATCKPPLYPYKVTITIEKNTP